MHDRMMKEGKEVQHWSILLPKGAVVRNPLDEGFFSLIVSGSENPCHMPNLFFCDFTSLIPFLEFLRAVTPLGIL